MPRDRPGLDRESPVDRETLAEWALAMVAALPPAALLAGLLAGDLRMWVRWTGFLLVVAAPVTYALVAWRVYRRAGMFVEEFRRLLAFGGLAWVFGTAAVAATLVVGSRGLFAAGGGGGFGPVVLVLLAIGAGLFGAASVARRAGHPVVRSVVLRSVAVQAGVVLVAGFPGSPVPAAAAWLGIAVAPVAGTWWHRLARG